MDFYGDSLLTRTNALRDVDWGKSLLLFSHMRLLGKKLLILKGKKHKDEHIILVRIFYEIECSFWGFRLFFLPLQAFSLYTPFSTPRKDEGG